MFIILGWKFREFLGYTEMFRKYVLKTKDFAYNNLKGIINKKYYVLLKGDKDSNTLTVDKSDYVSKVHKIIDKSINKGV